MFIVAAAAVIIIIGVSFLILVPCIEYLLSIAKFSLFNKSSAQLYLTKINEFFGPQASIDGSKGNHIHQSYLFYECPGFTSKKTCGLQPL